MTFSEGYEGYLVKFKVKTLRNSNTKQINIALGRGKGLNQFNNNIIEFQLIKIIKK